ncbi:MAG: ATP-grasp domain-containing protein [Clostridia bacterium]|nr:ATP-grasp domain-containing protein [Clostridia bacterium]
MTAIVTDAHYRMSLALIRDLADSGVRVIACEYDDIKNPAGFFSRGVSERAVISRDAENGGLFSLCKKVAEKTGERPVLFPVGAKTLEFVSAAASRLKSVCGLLVPSPEQLDFFNDKAQVCEFAKSLGIAVPRAYNIDEDIGFPAVVKPVCGEKAGLGAAERYMIVRDRAQLLSALKHFEKITGQPPVVQEYLGGYGAGCSVLAKEGQVLASVCHRRIREYPVTGGPSSCCKKTDAPQLLTAAARLVEAKSYSGVAMFEFKADAKGVCRLLEVNPRVWGTYPLTRVCGSNFTYMWYSAALDLPLPAFDGGREVKMVYYPSDFAAMLGYLKHGNIGAFLSGAADFFNPHVRNGLSEKGDRQPYRVYLKSLTERK